MEWFYSHPEVARPTIMPPEHADCESFVPVPPVDPGASYSPHTIPRPNVVRTECDPQEGVDPYGLGIDQPLRGVPRDSTQSDYEMARLDASRHGFHVEPA